MKKKMISMFLAAMMTFSLGIATYAADLGTQNELQEDNSKAEAIDDSEEEFIRPGKLQVSGKNIISAEVEKVGDMPEGMSYDDSTNTLTLNNCTIDPTERSASATIYMNSFDSYGKKYTIVLKGENTIYAPGAVGIETGTQDSVTIKGTGSLNIIHDSRCSLSPYTDYFTGIKIGGRAGDMLDSSALTIESCNINISADTKGMFYGISREAFNESGKKDFEILGSKISIEASSVGSQYAHAVAGIDTQGGNFIIKNSQINVRLDCDHSGSGIFPLATGHKAWNGDGYVNDGGKLTIEKSDVYMYTSGAARTKGAYAFNVAVDDSAYYYAGNHGLSKEISAKDAWSFNRYWDNLYRARYNCLAITQNALDPTELSMDFEDVPEGAWYYDNVEYVFKHELMSGLNDTTFGPNDPLARAQFATIMYRKEGKPEVSYTNRFKDVSDGNWYTDAIMWASDAGVVTGYSNGNFGPGDKINREQMAVMMYRYANGKGYDVSASVALNSYQDGNCVSGFAKQAMQWCVAEGIITGKNNGTQLDPQGNATRAECATIIRRFVEKYE